MSSLDSFLQSYSLQGWLVLSETANITQNTAAKNEHTRNNTNRLDLITK
jgi:hypothetical protein